MEFHNQVSETIVEIFNPSKDHAKSHSLKDFIFIIHLSSWSGLLPVQIAIQNGLNVNLRFVGCRLPLLVAFITLAIQLMLSILLAYQLLGMPIDVTGKVISMFDWFFFFVTAIIVPRITLGSLASLKLALDRLLTVHKLLAGTTSKFKPSYVHYGLASFFTVTSVIVGYFREARRVGTDLLFHDTCSWLAFIMYPIPKTYCIFATWLIPLQLFTLCRSLAHYLGSFRDNMQLDLLDDARTGHQITPEHHLHTRLERLQKVWVNLTDAIEATESYFRAPMLLFGASRVVNLVRHSHLLFKNVVELRTCWSKKYAELLNLLWTGANDLASFWLVIHSAELLHAAAEENKQRIKKYVYNNLTPQEGLQLHWFRKQVLGVQVQITAGGMFVIGKEIIPPGDSATDWIPCKDIHKSAWIDEPVSQQA